MIDSPTRLEDAIENGLNQCLGLDDSTEIGIKVAAEIIALHVKEYLNSIQPNKEPAHVLKTFTTEAQPS